MKQHIMFDKQTEHIACQRHSQQMPTLMTKQHQKQVLRALCVTHAKVLGVIAIVAQGIRCLMRTKCRDWEMAITEGIME